MVGKTFVMRLFGDRMVEIQFLTDVRAARLGLWGCGLDWNGPVVTLSS